MTLSGTIVGLLVWEVSPSGEGYMYLAPQSKAEVQLQ
jgi:hypothetical protein